MLGRQFTSELTEASVHKEGDGDENFFNYYNHWQYDYTCTVHTI